MTTMAQQAMARMSRRGSAPKNAVENAVDKMDMPTKHKAVFVDAKAMKDKLRENMHKPKYDVTNFYKEEGFFQQVARDSRFENITLGIISFNALWIAIDCDSNDADVLHEAHPVFIVAENLFCLFFTFELTMRFGAFKQKRNCLRDAWFVFDTFMVIMMIMETWVMTAILLMVGGSSGGGLGNAGMLRLLRLLRLSRMARMARLLRAMPELLILIKGMIAALRSVFFTLLLLMLLLYVYAILFRQLTAESTVGEEYFPTIIKSMNRLVLDGIIFDGAGDLLTAMMEEDQYLLIVCYYVFVLLAALTVMNMLIGVLCEVVSAVAEVEHEELTIQYVREKLQEIVEQALELEEGQDLKIDKQTFLTILTYPSSAGLLDEVDVNVFGLVDLVDTIFASESGKEKVLDFGDLVETMLDQRESNTATVKDVTELRKYVRGRVDILESEMKAHMASLGRLMEKTNGLPSGTWDAELKKCRQELDLETETTNQPSKAPMPKKAAEAKTQPPPQMSKPDIVDPSEVPDSGSAVVVGRSVDPPDESSPPDKMASGENMEGLDPPLNDDNTAPEKTTSKRKLRKKAKTKEIQSNNEESAPLAENADPG